MEVIELPRNILIEKGAINDIGRVCNSLGSKFVVVSDTVTKNIAGEKVSKLLSCDIVMISNSTMEEVNKVASQDCDCIVSVGGGKVIDVGKLAAHNKGVPFVSFPTACSHDGIVSKNASIQVDGKFNSFQASVPSAIVADVDILRCSPQRLAAAGAADVISNYTAVHDWKLADDYVDTIAKLSLLAADIVSSNTKDIGDRTDLGISNLIWALIFSGSSMSLAGKSSPASGAEHMFSHALDRLGPFGLHGEQVGLGTIFFSYLQGQDWKKIRSMLEELGAPTKAKNLNIPEDKLVEAFLTAKDIRKRRTILDEKPLDRQTVLDICKETGILD